MSKPLKQKQEEIIKSTDQRNHEHSRAHDSQDHGDAHRKFFNPCSQLNVNAANDAAVFNEILNEKMRQGVSNIRRKMYITFSVSAPTVDDAVPKLARIENQISQILTSIGSRPVAARAWP